MRYTNNIFLTLSFVTTVSMAQSPDYNFLEINNLKTGVSSSGDLFSNATTFTSEMPAGSGKYSLAIGHLWIGGIDAGGTLRLAAQTYRQTGTDYFFGPLNAAGNYDPANNATMNRVWKLNQCDIDAYSAWVTSGQPWPFPIDSTALEVINNWPAFNLDGTPLAPFNDIDSNGIYDPSSGDQPLIKGDQAIFFVYNDKAGLHTETGGAPLSVEIQGMMYGYSCDNDSALYNTVFTNYKIINKSINTINSVYIGNWSDLEIGYPGDDYTGSDVSRGAYYGYNSSTIDPSYGANPPAQGVVFLNGPLADSNLTDDPSSSSVNGTGFGDGIIDNERLGLSKFVSYNNDFSAQGNPSGAVDNYKYLTGSWLDGTPWTYGGSGHLTGPVCDYLFPGSSDPLGYGTAGTPMPAWDEITASNTPGDRRGLGSFGPFTFEPGETQEIDFAYVFAKATSGGNLASVTLMQERIDSIRAKFQNPILGCGCSGITSITETENNPNLSIYPNPTSNNLNIDYSTNSKNYLLRIIDATGRIISSENKSSGLQVISTESLQPGIYLLNILDNGKSITKRFIRQ
ncbi:MAG: T9SS type A sorting domain-containing protein [Bacteroidota bacterium]|nr:T9SS type A sorting domain-containing protein [Bacteroidota bacterium]